MDSGNFSDTPTPEGNIKTRTLLEAMERLGYTVVNVGERDVRLGYPHFAEMTEGRDLIFLSANIVRAEDGEPVFRPSVAVEAKSPEGGASRKVGLIGVARYNPVFRKGGPDGTTMEIRHPLEPVRREVARLRAQGVDLVVLLAALHIDDARRIVREAPGIDFVIGSYGGLVTSQLEREGETWLLYTGNQGKRIGETRVTFADDGRVYHETNIHFLTNVFPADPSMLDFVNAMPAPERPAAKTPVGGAAAEQYIGYEVCGRCHEAHVTDWKASVHARAMETLENKEGSDLPRCLVCHNTGFGRPGGFVSRERTPALAGVGCESCHGPGRAHIENPTVSYGKMDLSVCTVCHDRANSPTFDYYRDLARVKHGAAH